ncbi:MAG: hypothetical protein JOZ25_11215, partial [Actinobacteria bacterium]|nr:hypothetical protein [Actinomycetota bacterium]
VGALCTVAAVVVLERALVPRYGGAGRVACVLFALTAASSLLIGRIAFQVGLLFGVLAVYLAMRSRYLLACFAAAACALGSPLAGLFLALLAGSWLLVSRSPWAFLMAAAAVGPALVLQYAFREGGTFAYPFRSFLQLVVFVLLGWITVRRSERLIHVGLLAYLVLGLYALLIPSQLGGNVNRLGTIVGAPLFAAALWNGRRLFLALTLPFLLWWPLHDVLRDIPDAGGRGTDAAYYRPLNDYLDRHLTSPIRLEIPPTRNHWEGVYVGERHELARGWERQLDQKYDALYYGTVVTPERYRRWLDRSAVQYVALSDAPSDFASVVETDLMVENRLPFLRLVWQDRHWKLYRVLRATPLLSGPGKLTGATPDSFTIDAARPGRFTMRLHYSQYWAVTQGSGCVEVGPGNYTTVTLRRAGRARVATRFAFDRLVRKGRRCSG